MRSLAQDFFLAILLCGAAVITAPAQDGKTLRVLFQGDLFYFNGDPSFPPKDRMTVMPFFADWLKKDDLTPARIYGFHTMLFATMEHVAEVRQMFRADGKRK